VTAPVFLPATGPELAEGVPAAEYARLLGIPRGRPFEGDVALRAAGARAWYARHGRPFVAARRARLAPRPGGALALEGVGPLRSVTFAHRLREAAAEMLVVLAATAGPEVGEEVDRLWAAGKPDEAFFLDRLGAAVTERLVFWTGRTLCRAAEPQGETLLPHASPGCGDWDLGDQHALWTALFRGDESLAGPLELLPSGGLRPRHAALAAMGVTRQAAGAATSPQTPADFCRACDLSPCAFRRAPHDRAPALAERGFTREDS
jgi:hypothetical protein